MWSIHISRKRLAHGASVADTVAPAAWLEPRLVSLGRTSGVQVGAVIPTGFEAYARVFHPAGASADEYAAVRWSEVAAWAGRVVHPEMQWEAICRPARTPATPPPWSPEPAEGWCPKEVWSALVEVLHAYTTTPECCWVCLWDGWGGLQNVFPDEPRVRLPNRDYILLRAPLEVIASGVVVDTYGKGEFWDTTPSLCWPEDHAWCGATEIDYRWTYVAGSQACINDILADARLEALATDPHHRGDYLSDMVNGPVKPYWMNGPVKPY